MIVSTEASFSLHRRISPGGKMAQYAYLLRPHRPTLPFDATPEEQTIVATHFAYLKQHQAEGRIILVGRCEDGTFGITVYDAESPTEAETIMRNDPAVQAGIMTATLYPFRVALLRTSEPIAAAT
jgi:uncharacterized protein